MPQNEPRYISHTPKAMWRLGDNLKSKEREADGRLSPAPPRAWWTASTRRPANAPKWKEP